MDRLAACDYCAILDCLREIYASADVPALRRRLTAALSTLVDVDDVGIVEYDSAGRTVVLADGPERPERGSEAGLSLAIQLARRRQVARTWGLADSRTRRPRIPERVQPVQALATGQDVGKPAAVRHYLAFSVTSRSNSAFAVTLVRVSQEFSARDLALLGLLRPHLALAYGRAAAASQQPRRRRPGTGEAAGVTDHPLAPASDTLRSQACGRSLAACRLTPRESQVLTWVARGKTNAEIASLLYLSARTVQKHLEHIFEKLGVETRTAAAVRAIEMGGAAAR